MVKVFVATEAPITPDELRHDMSDAGVEIAGESIGPGDLVQAVVRDAPDLVVAASASPTVALFEAVRMLATLAPCPVVLFTSDGDPARIERGAESGIHAYVVDGYAKHRLHSIIQVARARFRHEQLLKEEYAGLSKRFEERKLVDRAKGALMRSRAITEDEAFELLRGSAMRNRQRIGVMAQSVIDMSRAGEAVNRSGQLRMLSQRIVKCYAQIVLMHAAVSARQMLGDSIARVDANLGILDRAISTIGYGDLVARVAGSWQALKEICAEPVHLSRLAEVDERAEIMLRDAETLTNFLESSGLVESLRILNLSGRLRLGSQRIGKLCFLVAIEPEAERLATLGTLAEGFEAILKTLTEAPLSSPAIRDLLEKITFEWTRLRSALDDLGAVGVLTAIAETSEKLLGLAERLTELYEQAMQTLVGNRIGHLR